MSSCKVTEQRYNILLDYLTSKNKGNCAYPSGYTANKKREIRQKATLFEMRDGLLFYKAEDVCGNFCLKLVIAKEEEKIRIIHACHDGVDGCHYGRDKTRSKVRDLARFVLFVFIACSIDQ